MTTRYDLAIVGGGSAGLTAAFIAGRVGAKAILIRPAPVPDFNGRKRSFALPEFDRFWQQVQDADIMVGLHGTGIVPVPLADVADKQRLVEPDDALVLAARSVGTSFGDG